MPAIPATITTVRAAVAWLLQQDVYRKPHVVVLKEIIQGSNLLFRSETHAAGSYSDVREGVCQEMAVEWIKENSVAKGADAFRRSIDSD